MKSCVIAIILGPENLCLMGMRNDTGKFTFPSGHIENNETPYQGLIREVKEETGLDIEDAKLLRSGDNGEGVTLYLYLCKARGVVDPKNDPDEEFRSLTWEDPLDRVEDLHIPYHKNWGAQWWAKNV